MEVLTRNWVRAFFDLDMDQMYVEKSIQPALLRRSMDQMYVEINIH